jgi:hypothetical protein
MKKCDGSAAYAFVTGSMFILRKEMCWLAALAMRNSMIARWYVLHRPLTLDISGLGAVFSVS